MVLETFLWRTARAASRWELPILTSPPLLCGVRAKASWVVGAKLPTPLPYLVLWGEKG